MNKGYEWIKKNSLKIFVVIVIFALVYTPYGMYKETQAQMNTVLEDKQSQLEESQAKLNVYLVTNRPRLRIDAILREGSISTNPPNQFVVFDIDYQLQLFQTE
ncbi:hypothetical protein ACFLV0_07440 [Chloroflexota bacterium]